MKLLTKIKIYQWLILYCTEFIFCKLVFITFNVFIDLWTPD